MLFLLKYFTKRVRGFLKNYGSYWDKLAPDENVASNFAHEYINDEPERYSNDLLFSCAYCLAHSGETINERFRQNRADEYDYSMAKMVSENKLRAPLVVYRGVCEHVFKHMVENARNFKGVDLIDKAMLSTSLVKGHEINAAYKLRIYVPCGVGAYYMGDVNYEENLFYEVVLEKELRLKIVSIDNEYINCEALI